MPSLLDNCSVIKEMGKAGEAIEACYKRVAVLERRLRENTLPEQKQEAIRKELLEVRKLLKTNEDHLSKLHGHNRQSFMLAIFTAFIVFVLYMLYILVVGLDY